MTNVLNIQEMHCEDRQQVLKRFLVNMEPRCRLDVIVEYLADEFDVAMAYISLSDWYWQWAKVQKDLSMRSMLHEFFVFSSDLQSPNAYVVPDLKGVSHFSNHPLVIGTPYLRFFACAPLFLSSGENAGTLCINDVRVRAFNKVDEAVLCSLRDLVVNELEVRQAAGSSENSAIL